MRGLLVTALGSLLLPASAVRTVSQSKPLTLLDPALSAGVASIPTNRSSSSTGPTGGLFGCACALTSCGPLTLLDLIEDTLCCTANRND